MQIRIHGLRKIAKKYYGKISEIVHGEVDIKAIILLITESISRSLLLMPAGLSVVLEVCLNISQRNIQRK